MCVSGLKPPSGGEAMVKSRQVEGVESIDKVTQIHHFYPLL